MLKRITVEKLRNIGDGPIDISFKPGLNLLTGKNGSGKTTILKLLWYLISGNLDKATDETRFSSLVLETDAYTLSISASENRAEKISVTTGSRVQSFEQEYDDDGDYLFGENVEFEANSVLVGLQKTVFFPTFRRLEGGYGIATGPRSRNLRPNDIEAAFENLSRNLSNAGHRFIAYVSTSDISRLLLERYAQISAEINKMQSELSQKIISNIKSYQIDDESDSTGTRAKEILEQVKQSIETVDLSRQTALQPMTAIEKTVSEIFSDKPIKIGSTISFGDAAQAISSEYLSAGEKQMLSFICYNALLENTIFFIDEPELSLHPDWQRVLFRVLEDQNPSNQFIVCTHSPFIYSKFPEREIKISQDLGDRFEL